MAGVVGARLFKKGKEIVVSHWAVPLYSFLINWCKISSQHWMPMTPDLLSVNIILPNQIGTMILPHVHVSALFALEIDIWWLFASSVASALLVLTSS
jgi:hypothetical protein